MGHSSPSQQVVNRVDYPDDGGRIELPETAESHSAVEQPPLAGATKTNVTDTTESTDPANSNPSYAAAETLRESISSDRSSELSESQEMDLLPDDGGLEDDEETGLTGKERRRQWRRLVRQRQQQRQNEAQWPSEVEDVRVTTKERRAADWTVVRRLGINAVLIGLWYLFSLSISVYNKWMFSPDHLDFHFPLFTTSLHALVQFSLASLILFFIPSLRPRQRVDTPESAKPLVTGTFYLTRLVPCGTATSLDIGLGNMSMRFITLTFFTMVKSSALAFVLLFAFVFRLEAPSLMLVGIIACMTVGVIMMVAGEAAFHAGGFVLVISSAFFSGFRWGLTQLLLLRHPATANPFATLFLLNPIMFLSLFALALAVEGPHRLASGLAALIADGGPGRAIGLLVLPGALAFSMIASEFALLQRSSVVTLSICGIFKEVVTIAVAGLVFHDPLSAVNLAGLVVTIASIATYNFIKVRRMRRQARLDVLEAEAEAERAVEEGDTPENLGVSSGEEWGQRLGARARN